MIMFKKIKYFILGAIFATSINVGISFAQDDYFQLKKVDYPIIVNGIEVNLESIILNFEGSTYIPLRKVADVTGSNVVWDNDRKSVFITTIPTETIKEVIKEVPIEKIVYVTPAPIQTGLKLDNGTYEGITNSGHMDKVGKYKWDSGDLYIGEWINDLRTGKGVYFFPNGNIYVGDFKDDKLSGNGSIIYANGNCKTGVWENDNLKTIKTDAYTSSSNPLLNAMLKSNEGSSLTTPDIIETKIDDDFDGLDSDNIYKMSNGQIWQQTSYDYEYHYKYRPDVLIYKDKYGYYKMKVEGCSRTPTVERLK